MPLKGIHKNPTVYISLILGALAGIWAYGFWLAGVFPLQSSRLLAVVILVMVTSAILFYIASIRLVVPALEKMTLAGRVWFWISCGLLGLFLYISTIDTSYIQNRYIYLLLPEQKLEIQAVQKVKGSGEDITLQGVRTSVGEVSFKKMQIEGWKRDNQDSQQLSLENGQENLISWVGPTGKQADLLFETSPAGGKVNVNWNGRQEIYDLYSADKGALQVPRAFTVPVYAGWVPLALIMILGYSAGVCLLFTLGLSGKGEVKKYMPGKYDWIWYALPMLAVWGFYLVVFYPGGMSVDSIDQWGQMITGRLVDWHPPFHTLTNWLITRIWYSPAAIALVQLLAMSGVLGWGLAVIRRASTPAWLVWSTSILLAVSPSNASLAIMVWKDVPFSILVVVLTILVLEIVLSQGNWLERKNRWLLLGVVLALVSLYRQNGVLVSVGTLICLLAVFRRYWKKLGLALLVYMALMGLITEGLFKAIHVTPNDMARYQIVLYNLIAAHQNNGTPFLPQEKVLIRQGFPEEKLPYVCYRNSDLVLFIEASPSYRRYLIQNTQPLIKLALDLTRRAPAVTVNHFACNGAFVYRMFEFLGDFETATLSISHNSYGLKRASLLPDLRPVMEWWNRMSVVQKGYNWLVWKAAFWMFLFISGCVCSCFRKKSWVNLLVIIPPALAVFPLIILSFGQIFRYVFPMYLAAILLGGYFWTMAVSDLSER